MQGAVTPEEKSAAKSYQPMVSKRGLETDGSAIDLERDSRNVFDSDMFRSSGGVSIADRSSNTALSNVKSAQLQRLVLLTQRELKEIRAYAANEIFKTRKNTDKLVKEFEKVKQMREDVRATLYSVKAGHVDIMDLDADKLHD